MLLELFLELDDMLEDQFLLGGVLAVGNSRTLLVLVLTTPLQLLVYHVFPALEEFAQLTIGFALHFKNINQTDVSSA